MEFDLRTILIIIGFLVIVVVAWDGWKRSKTKLKIKIDDKLNDSFATNKDREFDGSGFDQDGVSEVRVKRQEPVMGDESANQVENGDDYNHPELGDLDPFEHSEKKGTVPQEPDLVLSINLFSKKGHHFNGPNLLQHLLSLGLRFGDMGIFHRYTQESGSGDVQFSLANAYSPGTFDLENMESFATEGVCMFLTIPGPKDPTSAFDTMVDTANKLAKSLGGNLFDAEQSALTQQTIGHYREQIAEVARKNLTKKSA